MDPEQNGFQRGIDVLERLGDPELVDAYRQYAARLEATLGTAWLNTFAAMYQRDRRQLTGQAAGQLVSPEETAMRDRAAADTELNELYERFVELLARHKLLDERYTA